MHSHGFLSVVLYRLNSMQLSTDHPVYLSKQFANGKFTHWRFTVTEHGHVIGRNTYGKRMYIMSVKRGLTVINSFINRFGFRQLSSEHVVNSNLDAVIDRQKRTASQPIRMSDQQLSLAFA